MSVSDPSGGSAERGSRPSSLGRVIVPPTAKLAVGTPCSRKVLHSIGATAVEYKQTVQHRPLAALRRRNESSVKNLKLRATIVAVTDLTQGGTVHKRSVLLSEAHFAIEHVGRLKTPGATSVAQPSTASTSPGFRRAALRMELEAKAPSLRHWRAQSHGSFSPMAHVEYSAVE